MYCMCVYVAKKFSSHLMVRLRIKTDNYYGKYCIMEYI